MDTAMAAGFQARTEAREPQTSACHFLHKWQQGYTNCKAQDITTINWLEYWIITFMNTRARTTRKKQLKYKPLFKTSHNLHTFSFA
jgi:hypothetical protein